MANPKIKGSQIDPAALPSVGAFANDPSGAGVWDASNPYLLSSPVLPANTWETFGPTGSGADNIVTQMDNLPTDADWMEIKLLYDYFIAGAGTPQDQYISILWARALGSTVFDDVARIGHIFFVADQNGQGGAATIVTHRIPLVDGTNRFEMRQYIQNAGYDWQFFITGYGYNGSDSVAGGAYVAP